MDAASEKCTRRVGSDWLTVSEDRLVIHARFDMADWEVREIRPTMVIALGRRWQLVARSPGQADTIRFDLVPWPEARHAMPGRVITYDEPLVAARDAERAAGRLARRWAPAAFLLAPIIGFAWCRTRARFAETYGVSLRGSVTLAIVAEVMAVPALLWLTTLVMLNRAVPLFVPPALAFVLLVDAAARYHFVLTEVANPPGFLEWLLRRPPR